MATSFLALIVWVGASYTFFLTEQHNPALGIPPAEREFFIDNLLVLVHPIDWMTWLTGLAPWDF